MITKRQLNTLISPDWDVYAQEHISLLYESIEKKVLKLERRELPNLPPRTEEEKQKTRVFAQAYHTQESFDYAARILYWTFKDRIENDSKLKILTQPWYSAGKGDVGLVRLGDKPSDYTTLIVVEIGTMRGNKPLRGLEGSVEEFWIPVQHDSPPYFVEEERIEAGIYVFKRGSKWHLWEEYQRREKLKVERKIREVDPRFKESPPEAKDARKSKEEPRW